MKAVLNIGVLVVAISCVAALAIGVYPGWLGDLLFFPLLLFLLFGVPFFWFAATLGMIAIFRSNLQNESKFLVSRVCVLLALLFGTFVLLALHISPRIAFAFSRSSFDELVALAKANGSRTIPLDRQIGIYQVDEYGVD